MILSILSAASVVASVHTAHWFAVPFAALFLCGYGYVSLQLIKERVLRSQRVSAVYYREGAKLESGQSVEELRAA
jgi:hypothetical protein